MKCMNVKGLEAYQVKKILKMLEKSLRNKDWSEMRKFGRENREVSRDCLYLDEDIYIYFFPERCIRNIRSSTHHQVHETSNYISNLANGTLDIHSDSSSNINIGCNCVDNLKLATSSTLTVFESSILNISNTFFKIFLMR